MKTSADPAATRAAVLAVEAWIRDPDGPRHTRGTPPNVVEVDPHTWLQIATGLRDLRPEDTSGTRAAEVAHWLPIVPL